jgi:hypothetical protein
MLGRAARAFSGVSALPGLSSAGEQLERSGIIEETAARKPAAASGETFFRRNNRIRRRVDGAENVLALQSFGVPAVKNMAYICGTKGQTQPFPPKQVL